MTEDKVGAEPDIDFQIEDPYGFMPFGLLDDGSIVLGDLKVVPTSDGSMTLEDEYGFITLDFADAAIGGDSDEDLAERAPLIRYYADGLYIPPAPHSVRYRQQLARMLAGTATLLIAIIGDSTSWGRGSEGSGVTLRAHAPAAFMTRYLDRLLPDGARDTAVMGSGFECTEAEYHAYNPDLTFGSGWAYIGAQTAGGKIIRNSTTTAGLVYNRAGAVWDTAWVFFANFAAGSASITDGTTTATLASTSGSIQKLVLTRASAATGALTINRISGQPDVCGVILFDSTRKDAIVLNMGRDGWKVSNWLDIASFYSAGNMVSFLAAGIVIIKLGLNEAWAGR